MKLANLLLDDIIYWLHVGLTGNSQYRKLQVPSQYNPSTQCDSQSDF